MTTFIILCLVAGGAGAILQGMVGIGTGLVVIPLLSFTLPRYGMDKDLSMHIALATSMAAIMVNSISAVVAHQREGNIRWSFFNKIIFYCVLGALIGALIASYTSGSHLETIFGVFMICTAIYMLFKKEATQDIQLVKDISLPTMATSGVSIGLVASIIGTGGGTLLIPFMQSLRISMRETVGTATLIGFPIALIGTATYIITGIFKTPATAVTIGYLHWPAFLAVSCAGVLCAPFGARLATILPAKLLRRVFALCMLIVGFKMFF